MNQEYSISISKNTFFYFDFFSKFLEKEPRIPLCNRDYIRERVNYFYDKIIEYRNQNILNNKIKETTIPYFNIIHIASLDNELYICDGQHRFYAYKKYYDNYHTDFQISYVVKICENKDELKQYFRDLNNIFILHEIILNDNDIDILERVKIYMKNNYEKHISKSAIPRFPNVNIDQLVKYLLNTFPNNNYEKLIDKLELLNENMKDHLLLNNKPLYDLAISKQGFFIGYLFIKTESENKRKNIPKTVRDFLWNNHFGESLEGYCYVCKNRITYHTFHAGHIISVKNGGSDNITNLEVICSSCNLSMGSKNLNEFKNKYF